MKLEQIKNKIGGKMGLRGTAKVKIGGIEYEINTDIMTEHQLAVLDKEAEGWLVEGDLEYFMKECFIVLPSQVQNFLATSIKK